MAGQNDQQDESLTGQVSDQAGHCPLTGGYFQPWKRGFRYSDTLLWNNLPEEIHTSNSLSFFKRSSHRWFSDQYSHMENK